ncbi:hypothetical protein COCON_G00162650 [Conger conger]|uniref:Uncharacterized protein n=1 Tax=Conger conger TaxID=82655 RepID=A0A9Q1D615_CONCO|nr:hypothetical protein COCON_G00162650 [Conger conger]
MLCFGTGTAVLDVQALDGSAVLGDAHHAGDGEDTRAVGKDTSLPPANTIRLIPFRDTVGLVFQVLVAGTPALFLALEGVRPSYGRLFGCPAQGCAAVVRFPGLSVARS